MKIVFATQNEGKKREIKRIFQDFDKIEPFFLDDFAVKIEPPFENGKGFEENAILKAKYYKQFFEDFSVVSEDSGLCVAALGGAPGINSARFEGLKNDIEKCNRILDFLKDVSIERRVATFVCVVAFLENEEQPTIFKGEVEGKISLSKKGGNGFGYDPIFIPDGDKRTFAEMGGEEKDKFGHRKKALNKLKEYLVGRFARV
jgi:XTP/dITP diphosphohydrolase